MSAVTILFDDKLLFMQFKNVSLFTQKYIPLGSILKFWIIIFYFKVWSFVLIQYIALSFFGKVDIDLTEWYCQYQWTDIDTGRYWSVWHHNM